MSSVLLRRSAAADVQAELQAQIEGGKYKQNERLPSEAELARAFQVSRPVIREALMSLQALGLTAPQTGVAGHRPERLILLGKNCDQLGRFLRSGEAIPLALDLRKPELRERVDRNLLVLNRATVDHASLRILARRCRIPISKSKIPA